MIQRTIMPQIKQVMYDHSIDLTRLQLRRKKMPAGSEEKKSGRCLELIEKNDFWNKDPGIQNGLAGLGMSLLTELDGNDSWISLFPNDLTPVKK